MRAAVIADTHIDQHKRFEETKRLLAWQAADACERGCTATLHCGDVYERKSTPLDREAASDWCQAVTEYGPLVIVRGNHDAVDDLPLLAKLDSANPIIVVETAAVVEVAGALIACVAWPRKAALLAATGAEGHEAGEAMAAEALRNVLRGLGDELAEHDGPTALLMHAMVRDSVTSTGQPLVGCDLEVGLDDLALVGADAYLLGHIHMQQHWQIGAAPCIYPGSPRRCNFGEIEPKGYVVVEWDDATGELVGWDFVEMPTTPMMHIEATWRAETSSLWTEDDVDCRGAEVRLRYTTPSDARAAARADAEQKRRELLDDGALSVKLEERVLLEQRTRGDAIPVRASLVEKVEAFWAAKRFEPGDRREALTAKVRWLEEARQAS
jgi:DNA repair exonuclease SbcCD nuclease subunit